MQAIGQPTRRPLGSLIGVLLVMAAAQSPADNYYWDGGGGGDPRWFNATNWYAATEGNDVVPQADDTTFVAGAFAAQSLAIATGRIDQAGAASSKIHVGYKVGSLGLLRVEAGSLATGGNLELGVAGHGTCEQLDGSVTIGNELRAGLNAGSLGTYRLADGTLSAFRANIGENGTGTVEVAGGLAVFRSFCTLGKTAGFGRIVQSGGEVDVLTNFYLGFGAGSAGAYELEGGELKTLMAWVGNSAGNGSIRQSGGTHLFRNLLMLGRHAGTRGEYTLTGGTLTATNGDSEVVVGWEGRGLCLFGDATASGLMNEGVGGNGLLTIRKAAAGQGVFRGWGTVAFKKALQNDGQVIADGYGSMRDLDLSSFTDVRTNYFANTTSNGWFAIRGGRLRLPGLSVSGNATVYWGEKNNQDLVNSVKLTFANAGTATLTGALLAKDRTDVPAGVRAIGLWTFTTSSAAFDSVILTFRYDDADAAALGLPEADLALLRWSGSKWENVTGALNTTLKTITSEPLASWSTAQFAVGQRVQMGTVLSVR